MFLLKEMMTPIHMIATPETKLREAIEIMQTMKWNIIPITDLNGKLLGVFTRSQLYDMFLQEKSLNTLIYPFMIKDVVVLPLDTPFDVLEQVVWESRVGTGVVVDENEHAIGLFTKTDMVMALLKSTKSYKEQLEAILENSQLSALITTQDGEIIYANHRFRQLVHQSFDQIKCQRFQTYLTSDDNFELKPNIIKKVQLHHVQTIMRSSSYMMVNGKKGYILLFQDISEIESMAQELQSVKNLKQILDTAIDHDDDGLVMIDHKKIITMVNPPLLELFQLNHESVIGKSIDHVLPHLNVSRVLESGEAELSDFMELNGIKFIVNRIPIAQDGKQIGVLAKVMYRQLNEVSRLFKKLEKAENKASFYREQLKKEQTAKFTWDQIISADPYVEKLKKSAAKAAKGRSTILINGESGTGKELFAHAIHNSSARKAENFVVINCAAIPEHLLESEFFGYEEGAFTGAKQKGKIGKFDLANGGTLFLDEIGDMSLSLQAKLLRVLQEREFYRVGGMERIHVDVRVIAATNRHLEEMVKQGTFREDLYYRLNVISLKIPSLRERKYDIELLIKELMIELNRLLGTSITGMDEGAKKALLVHDWPGNVRELKNIMERAMTFAESGEIQIEDLPDYLIEKVEKEKKQVISLVESAELSMIKQVLIETNGNKVKAAKKLGISRSSLYEKLKKYKL